MDTWLPKRLGRRRLRPAVRSWPVMLSLLAGAGLAFAGILSRTLTAREPAVEMVRLPSVTLPLGELPVAPAPTEAPRSRAQSAVFFSRALHREMPYLVYLPPGYDADSEARYPTLYMLHGMGGTYTEWYGYGIFDAADRLIRAGLAAPFLIVLPQGDFSYWVDHANGGPRWGAYVAEDVVREIDSHYRTAADRRHRAIGGLSMGAHGALQLAMNYPEVFGVAGAHSPTLRGREDAPEFFGDAAYFKAHDPVTLVRDRPDEARALSLWVDVGTSDFWFGVVTAFHDELAGLGVMHQWQEYPGGHTPEYWAAHVDEYLRFYGAALEGRFDRGNALRP